MNVHKNARLTFVRRMELVNDVLQGGLTQAAAARLHRVSVPTVRKWVSRFVAEGQAGLRDRSSRPKRSPGSIAQTTADQIVEGRRRYLTQARIAASTQVSKSTVGRVLRRAGLSRLSDLQPAEPPQRYEHELPGDLVHIDTKKLGRIERMGHRITGNPRDNTDGAGWEFLFVAIDDHARIGFTDLYPDERHASAVQFLRNMIAYFASLGVRVRRILTDNGWSVSFQAFRGSLSSSGLEAQIHPCLPAADQWQGRALHPIGTARMGLRHCLQPLQRTRPHARTLDTSLQLASPSPGHRRPHSHDQTPPIQK